MTQTRVQNSREGECRGYHAGAACRGVEAGHKRDLDLKRCHSGACGSGGSEEFDADRARIAA